MMPSLRIVAFFDGRLGHEKQTRGLLQALAKLTATHVDKQAVRHPAAASAIRNWRDYLVGSIRPSRHTAVDCDLLIGTGTYTHIPMLLHRKQFGGRVVTCMTPDRLLKGAFDLCFVPRHDRQPPADNYFFTTGSPNNVVFKTIHNPRRGLILVGGIDPKSHHWDTAALMDRIDHLVTRSEDIVWTVSSSPRTPRETSTALEAMAARRSTVCFYRAEETPSGWIEEQYTQNERVWVTADSISMIFEALTAGCRVGVLPVRWKRKVNKFQRSIDDLIAEKRVTFYPTWIEQQDPMVRGKRLNEASRCAKELLKRWWPERLR